MRVSTAGRGRWGSGVGSIGSAPISDGILVIPPKSIPNVSSSCSSSDSNPLQSSVVQSSTDSLSHVTSQSEEQKPKQKPFRSESETNWLRKYGKPKPVEFDSWDQVTRSEWHYASLLDREKANRPARVSGKPAPITKTDAKSKSWDEYDELSSPDNPPIYCAHCNVEFPWGDSKAFQEHAETVHGIKPFTFLTQGGEVELA
jgi:hypothetical protein